MESSESKRLTSSFTDRACGFAAMMGFNGAAQDEEEDDDDDRAEEEDWGLVRGQM